MARRQTGFSWSGKKSQGHFNYSEIVTIRLEWAASRADTLRHACHVVRFNGWTETIVSTHYAGPMNFEDRRAGYSAFVRSLIARTAKANPSCRFVAGASMVSWLGSMAILGGSLILLALVLMLTGVPTAGIVIAKLIILAWLVPLGIAWIRRNRPRDFTPPDIPQNVIPELTSA